MKRRGTVVRYTTPERINHWITAFCFIPTAVSGMGFLFPSSNWLMHIMGTSQLARTVHPFVGVIMFASFIIMFFRYWHHDLINRDDIFRAKNTRKIVVNERVDDAGRYNFGQKYVFWAAVIFLVLLLMSGVVVRHPYFAPAFSIPVIRFTLVLYSLAVVALIVVIMVHTCAALWVKDTIITMVEGWVTSSWAKKHHPRWYHEVRQKQEKSSERAFA